MIISQLDAITTLKEYPNWVTWRYEKKLDGKVTKIPYIADRSRTKASSADPDTWRSYEEACSARNCDGIGFVFSREVRITGIDLDHAVGTDGKIEAWAQDIVNRLNSYTEVTPSGAGLHILLFGVLPEDSKHVKNLKLGNGQKIEVYSDVRFFTFTGNHLPETPLSIEERQGELLALYSELFPEIAKDNVTAPENTNVSLEDSEFLEKLFNEPEGAKWKRLWHGDNSDFDGDESDGDLSLCNKLAFYAGRNPQRMDSLFRTSGRMRPKWDERRGAHTYGERTITLAIEGCTEVYGGGDKIIFKLGSRSSRSAIQVANKWPEPLAPEAFYGITGDVVSAIAPHSEADPVALLVNFLVFAGNCIGRGPHTIAEADRHSVNFFAALVGETSKGRKGSSTGRILDLFSLVDPEWAATRINAGLSSGEGLIWAVRDPIQKEVQIKDKGIPTGHYVTEVTDTGISDKRLLCLESEFASILKVMARDGNTLSTTIRQAWDKGNLSTLVKNSPARATDAHVSILAHIVKNELLRYLTDTETANGFANRFLWACTRRSQVLPEGGGDCDYSELVERLQKTIFRARTIGLVIRDNECKQVWAEIYRELSEGRPGLLGAVTARAEAQVLRLSVLYAALDNSNIIQIPHLLAAIAVWEYCERSCEYIFGTATGDPIADRIMTALQNNAEGLDRTTISDLFGRNIPVARLDLALGNLCASGRIRNVKVESGTGRPREVWIATV